MTDNLRIWSKVEKTNPAHTKKVNQRGGFTAISAAFQIKNATEQFGPIGEGWGYITGDPIIIDTLITVPVSLWHGDRANIFGPMLGCEEWKDKNGRVDSDAPKKAVTDGLTKLLSQLGFNADVFLGRFDDSKYVAEMVEEFAAPPSAVIQTATASLAMCRDEADLKEWMASNGEMIAGLSEVEKQGVRKAYAARQTAIKSATNPFEQKAA
jgi:hypothetical protein